MLQRNTSGSPLIVMTDPPQSVGPGETIDHPDLLGGFEAAQDGAEQAGHEVPPAAEVPEPAPPMSPPVPEPAAPAWPPAPAEPPTPGSVVSL